ncbi:hypothetical protein L1987_36773 [Smallanthus sonchifolius]|uniref:Uncharacterized protein n=1 Tax=Smallanthus sonchifolius TaxID=185202 RepID=A0ACB9HEI0_9ASTR|nr:hypothetical protein L1987_36773 [Smallanthus sonchifolius]
MWNKKGFRPSYRHVEGGKWTRSGDGSGEKKEANMATIDLTEETEVLQRRIKTVREREIETKHGGKKLKKEGLGQPLVKEVEKGEDVMTGEEKEAGAGHQALEEDISELKTLLGVTGAGGSGGGGDDEDGDSEE